MSDDDDETTISDDVPACPWCGAWYDDFVRLDKGELDCAACGNTYNYTSETRTTYTTRKVRGDA